MIRYLAPSVAVWTIIVTGMLVWNFRMERLRIDEEVRMEARAIWDHNLSYREWVTAMGGVYVRRDRMEPNPYLRVPDRDTRTIDGVALTMANPAYMTSQVFDLIRKESSLPVINRIVSEKYLNPHNKPDAWEAAGLQAFAAGTREISEVTVLNGQPYFRLFKPMITTQGCLKCHGRQGYRVGDIRGGISIAIPMRRYYEIESRRKRDILSVLLPLWGIGSGVIIVLFQGIEKGRRRVEEGEARLDLALDAANEAWWEWDVRTGKTVYSPRYYQMLGYEPSEFPPAYEEWKKRIHPDDIARIDERIRAHLVEEKSDYHGLEMRMLTRGGQWRWISVSGKIVERDGNGDPVRLVGTYLDIDDRKRTEEDLRAYSAEIEDLYNHAPCGYHSLGRDGMFLRINDTELQWLGYDRDELVGKKRFTDFVTERGRAIFTENFPLFMKQGWIKDLEFELVRKDGTILPVLVSAAAIYDEAGNYLMSRSTVFDIAERRRSEESLRAGEQRYRDIFDNVLDGLYLLEVTGDGRFRTMEVNPALERSTGIPREKVIGRTQEEIVPPEVAEIVNAKYRRCVEAGRPIDEEVTLDLPAGRRHYHSTLIPVSDRAGKVNRIIGISRDITERKQAEERLRDSEERYRTLFEGVPDALVIADLETGTIGDANPGAERLFGRPRGELIGMHQSALHPAHFAKLTRQSFQEHSREAGAGRICGPFEHIILRSDGREVPVEVMTEPVTISGKRMIQGVFRDISERKRTVEALRELNEDLDRRVTERTAELERKNAELERMNKVFVGRELRMAELKEKMRKLEERIEGGGS